ncbi:MAG: biotin-dependent carboxyltransferase family protein [Chloroflexota bacterium]
MSRVALEVLDAGFLSTIQDLGRFGYEHLGVPHAGACDPVGHVVANVLLGNDPSAATLEMTLVGPTLLARGDCTVALGGADLGAVVRDTERAGFVRGAGRRVFPGTTTHLRDGEVLEFAGATTGARGYLALPGGIDVPSVLGSRSTYLAAGIGGLDGRTLTVGDAIRAAGDQPAESLPRVWPGAATSGDPWLGETRPGGTPPRDAASAHADPARFRVLRGPDVAAGRWSIEPLLVETWAVDPRSDRVGLRLVGDGDPPSPSRPWGNGDRGTVLSRPTVWGAVQVPPSGYPVVLGVDHQTVGGYPVVAVVASVDLPKLAQLRPGARVRFVEVDRPEALRELRAQAEGFARSVALLGADIAWQDAWLDAGA